MILMHQDMPVAEVAMAGDRPAGIGEVFDRSLLPAGVWSYTPMVMDRRLAAWDADRAVPDTRQDMTSITRALGMAVPQALLRSMRVSLTDTYWFRPEDSSLSWADVNYHDNGFSQDLAKTVLEQGSAAVTDFRLPDLTTDGLLKKAWLGLDRVPVLVKGGNLGPNAGGKNLLSANEVIASRLAGIMDIPHAEYTPVRIRATGEIMCICPCFVTDPDTDFVTALQMMNERPDVHGRRLYDAFCSLGFRREAEGMVILDHVLHNTDRHEKNLGLLIRAGTRVPYAFAPIFDTGSCLGWNRAEHITRSDETQPFCRTRQEQLALIPRTLSELPGPETVKELIRNVYEGFGVSEACYDIACDEIDGSYDLAAEHDRALEAYIHVPEEEAEEER